MMSNSNCLPVRYVVIAFLGIVFCLSVYKMGENHGSLLTSIGKEETRETKSTSFTQGLPKVKETPGPKKKKDEPIPIPDDSVLAKMSVKELSDFYHGYIHGTQVLCSRRVRMGHTGDGGWDVCEEQKYKFDPKSCLVYSFGLSTDVTFDDAIQKFGCEVHGYDPSLGDTDPSKGYSFHFHKVGIGSTNTKNGQGWILQTLGKTREENGHSPSKRRVDMVKMDVEGAELESLKKAVTEGSLDDVRQLAWEIHMKTSNGDPRKDFLLQVFKLLRDLWLKGFRLFHTNRNVAKGNLYTSTLDKKYRTSCYEIHMLRVHY